MRTFIYFIILSCIFCFYGYKSPDSSKERAIKQIVDRIKLPEIGSVELYITDFGAVGDGITDCKPAIDAAMAKVSSKGGGKIVFPKGNFFCKGPNNNHILNW